MKRNGTREWIFQRISTLLITVYSIAYITLFLSIETYDYTSWLAMHNGMAFKIYSTITLIMIMSNSLLAGWQIGTDYTQKVPLPGFGTIFHCFYPILSLAFLAFGLYILWLM